MCAMPMAKSAGIPKARICLTWKRRGRKPSTPTVLGERRPHGGSLNHRQMEIADESGNHLAAIDAKDVLFQGGQLGNFSDDVTKSAPSASLGSAGSKAAAR
jgi:hypothetical protein